MVVILTQKREIVLQSAGLHWNVSLQLPLLNQYQSL